MVDTARRGRGAEGTKTGDRDRARPEGAPPRRSPREAAARTYPRALPIVPVRARGLTVEGADGRRYLDCLSGAGTLALGHNHPVVLEAVRKVLESGAPLHVPDLSTPVKDAFVTELLPTLPPRLAAHARVRFCGPAAGDAVRAASRLVRAATGRTGIAGFDGAEHGTTPTGALAVHGDMGDARVTHLPYPQDYRCPFGVGGPRGAELAAHWAESVLDGPGPGVPPPAGVILEPVHDAGGVLPAPDAWLRRIRRITAARDIPLIVDESCTGVGRTGALWGVRHSGATPDVMVLSRAIGGSLPLAVLVHREDLDTGQQGAPTGPFRGNQLAMAAGAATLAYVRENRLADHAARLGARMLARLRALAGEFACVGEVRGRGLMIGVELVEPDDADGPDGPGDPHGPNQETQETHEPYEPHATHEPHGTAERRPDTGLPVAGTGPQTGRTPRAAAPELAAAVQRACLRRGLIVDVGGPHANVVRLLPPLTITDEQAAAVLDRLADAVAAATGHGRHGRDPRQRRPQPRGHGSRGPHERGAASP